MYFRDRGQAAEQLAKKLSHFTNKNPLILGIPRGALPMASIIADQLKGELDIVLVHKIGAPDNPELAVGSVSEFGETYHSDVADRLRISRSYLEKAAQEEIEKLKKRRQMYSPIRAPIDPRHRIVIIVDDGIATGATILSAVLAIRARSPERVVIAAPVASPSATELLRSVADEEVFLDVPEDFFSISQFYEDFPQVSDDEVIRILSKADETAVPRRTTR